MKKIIFYISLGCFLILVNSGGATFILDNLLGLTWSAPITEFIEKNSQGFIIVFLLALYWDYFHKSTSSSEDEIVTKIDRITNFLENNDINNKNLDELVREKIQEHYRISNDVSNLLDVVISEKTIHTDVNVSYKLRNGESEGKYYLRYRYDFKTLDKEFYIAFLTSSDIQDQLVASTDAFFDMFVFSDLKYMNDNIEKMQKEGFCIKAILDKNGTTFENVSKFQKIEEPLYNHLLPGWFDQEKYDILIYKASFQHDCTTPVRYIYSHEYVMDVSDNYCYWVSDRTLYLEKIQLDLESFLHQNAKFTLQPFIANGVRSGFPKESSQRIYELNVNNWVVKGQGVIIVWRD